MPLSIVPLNVGNFEALPKETCMYRMYRGITYPAPCVIWYIQGSKNKIIVDLGPQDPAQCLENHGMVIKRSEKQMPANACKAVGLSPEDVKIVVLTHLHWDHVGGFDLFKNARFLVQRKEIAYAIAPYPCQQPIYFEKNLGKPEFVDNMDRIDVIEGDCEIEAGVRLILIPSHSPGFQGVLVDTGKGKYFIAGDAVGLFECWERVPHVPSSVFVNLADYYASMDRIDKMADYVLPGHDGKVFDKPGYP